MKVKRQTGRLLKYFCSKVMGDEPGCCQWGCQGHRLRVLGQWNCRLCGGIRERKENLTFKFLI